jgi:hypothetical protein
VTVSILRWAHYKITTRGMPLFPEQERESQ